MKKIISHPKYVSTTPPFRIDNDIALIHVKDPIDLNLKNVKPVCLPEANDDPTDNLTLTVSGWGRRGELLSAPEQLMSVQVPVVNRTYCNDQLKAYRDKGETNITQPINERMFCAGPEEGRKGVCGVSYRLIIYYP